MKELLATNKVLFSAIGGLIALEKSMAFSLH